MEYDSYQQMGLYTWSHRSAWNLPVMPQMPSTLGVGNCWVCPWPWKEALVRSLNEKSSPVADVLQRLHSPEQLLCLWLDSSLAGVPATGLQHLKWACTPLLKCRVSLSPHNNSMFARTLHCWPVLLLLLLLLRSHQASSSPQRGLTPPHIQSSSSPITLISYCFTFLYILSLQCYLQQSYLALKLIV